MSQPKRPKRPRGLGTPRGGGPETTDRTASPESGPFGRDSSVRDIPGPTDVLDETADISPERLRQMARSSLLDLEQASKAPGDGDWDSEPTTVMDSPLDSAEAGEAGSPDLPPPPRRPKAARLPRPPAAPPLPKAPPAKGGNTALPRGRTKRMPTLLGVGAMVPPAPGAKARRSESQPGAPPGISSPTGSRAKPEDPAEDRMFPGPPAAADPFQDARRAPEAPPLPPRQISAEPIAESPGLPPFAPSDPIRGGGLPGVPSSDGEPRPSPDPDDDEEPLTARRHSSPEAPPLPPVAERPSPMTGAPPTPERQGEVGPGVKRPLPPPLAPSPEAALRGSGRTPPPPPVAPLGGESSRVSAPPTPGVRTTDPTTTSRASRSSPFGAPGSRSSLVNAPPTHASRSKPHGISRLSLVLAVVLPLAAGAGAGVALFRNPKPAVSSAEGARTSPNDPSSPGTERPTAQQEGDEATADEATAGREQSRAREQGAPKADEAAKGATADGSLLARAERGDPKALEALGAKEKSERTVGENLALARGRVARNVQALRALEESLASKPLEVDGRDMDPRLVKLKEFIEDRDTSVRALELAASLPTPIGPDILYDTWVGTRGRNETTWLAEQLVYTEAVRERASEALKVALDLRAAAAEEDCEATRDFLPRAAEHGDRRSARLLGRLLRKRGCGDRKLDDCYPCLRPLDRDRKATSVRKALALVRTRRAPRLP